MTECGETNIITTPKQKHVKENQHTHPAKWREAFDIALDISSERVI